NEVRHAKEVKFGNLDIKYTSLKSVNKKTENPNLLLTDSLGTDLLPGVYEGGFKVWECAFDLANYLAVNNCIKANDAVLELGCGAGLPGIVSYICGASVAFQDLNSEVLEHVTIPNVMLNTSEDKYAHVKQKCAFLSGDWECIRKCFYSYAQETNLFDVILSSETIYEKVNQIKLLNLMKAALKKEGTVFIAAKIHYFGVSGGILDFEKLVEEDGTFTISTVERFTNGFERRIMKMKRKNTS
ncbi:histidine protein methyltransferase 1 homolog, partial [Stegodyphus dumicola]|uniref:histidine protein methyltransferase 1 homolog n=1 Tax=Stegodyphus dumicola TaxID=202533 RepID=UPI0015AFFDE7